MVIQVKGVNVPEYSEGIHGKGDVVSYIDEEESMDYYISTSNNNDTAPLDEPSLWLPLSTENFNFSDFWQPTYSAQIPGQPLRYVTPFGDGYRKIITKNLFPMNWAIGLTFENVSDQEAKGLLAFFEYKKGVTPFLFKPLSFMKSRKFYCKSWKHSYNGYNMNVINAQFSEFTKNA
jgi:phage-related protein